MNKVVLRVFIVLIVVLATFMWVGSAITKLTGGEKKAGGAVEISPEGGEEIYWGKGRCFTCHSIGDRGSAVRCPNHGAFGDKFPLAMGQRAVERAKEREQKTGLPYTATDYLVEALADPGAHIVEGYKNEMAVVYAPPISLSLDEIKAVVAYMQSLGGDVDLEALNNPSEITKKFYGRIAAASAAGGGDPGRGEEVFFEMAQCAECHTIGSKGTALGPDLSSIGLKGVKPISDAILRPAESFTPGFETYTVFGKDGKEMFNDDGRMISGVKVRETAEFVEIAIGAGAVEQVAKSEIKEIVVDKNRSVMPDDLIEAMTVKDFQDVLAYLLLHKGEAK